jgi:hypothetical protein
MTTREDKNTFSLMIEETAALHNISCMEAITEYCLEHDLEIEVAAALVNQSLKAKIEQEARALRFLPKTGKLPL